MFNLNGPLHVVTGQNLLSITLLLKMIPGEILNKNEIALICQNIFI
jgi:hypothetical protein